MEFEWTWQHFPANRKVKSRGSDRFYFLGPKITVDVDMCVCDHAVALVMSDFVTL